MSNTKDKVFAWKKPDEYHQRDKTANIISHKRTCPKCLQGQSCATLKSLERS